VHWLMTYIVNKCKIVHVYNKLYYKRTCTYEAWM